MAGKPNHAQKLAKHLDTEIDAACMIQKAGATATVAIGGVVAIAAGSVLTRKPSSDEIKVVTNGWLAVGPRSFALVNGDKFLGNPKGDPYAVVPYADVRGVEVKRGHITARADVTLLDGRVVAFETKRKGPNKLNPQVLDLLAQRCR